MLKIFSLDNDLETKEWDSFVQSHPKGSPYHLTSWIRTIQETYSFQPFLYVYYNRCSNISGILPFFLIKTPFTGSRIISLPFTDYCSPLIEDNMLEKEFLSEIIKKNEHKIKYIEIRGNLNQTDCFICHNYYKKHILFFDSNPSKTKKILDKRTIQYSIRKAEKRGVKIIEDRSYRGIEEFYRLNMLTRKKHGVPCQPKKFFNNLFQFMISNEYAFILLAIYDSQVLAASLFFRFKDGIYYKYNATDPKYLSKITPNHLLTWQAIEKAYQEGYQYIDFGRTSPDNEGLMRYKKMWGARCFDLPYFYYPKIRGVNAKKQSSKFYNLLTKTWRSMPDFVSAKIGPKIYKYTA